MKRRPRDYDRDFRRASPKAERDGNTFLIVVEGEQTERLYLEGLCRRLGLKSAHVTVTHAGATDPQGMLNHALKLRDARAAEARNSPILVAYDEVWIVIDCEAKNHPRARQLPDALATAGAKNIHVALTDPAFEFWLLLHYEYTTTHFPDAKAVRRSLKKHVKDYEKNALPLADLFSKLPTAVKHAGKCHEHHSACGGDGNPSTRVHLLAKSLNASAAPSARLL